MAMCNALFVSFSLTYIIDNSHITRLIAVIIEVWTRAPDKVHIFIPKMHISSPNPMFGHLLESSHGDDSNKWSNIGFGEEITKIVSIEFYFTYLIWSSAGYFYILYLRLSNILTCFLFPIRRAAHTMVVYSS